MHTVYAQGQPARCTELYHYCGTHSIYHVHILCMYTVLFISAIMNPLNMGSVNLRASTTATESCTLASGCANGCWPLMDMGMYSVYACEIFNQTLAYYTGILLSCFMSTLQISLIPNLPTNTIY